MSESAPTYLPETAESVFRPLVVSENKFRFIQGAIELIASGQHSILRGLAGRDNQLIHIGARRIAEALGNVTRVLAIADRSEAPMHDDDGQLYRDDYCRICGHRRRWMHRRTGGMVAVDWNEAGAPPGDSYDPELHVSHLDTCSSAAR